MVKNTVRSLLREAAAMLGGSDSPAADARVLLCHALGCDTARLLSMPDDSVPEEAAALFLEMVRRRARHEPVAYITGYRDFMSLRIKVKHGVLIPRPETETLVEYVIEKLKGKKCHILDICTGSGCIAVSLAKYLPECHVTAADVSEAALEVAQSNVAALGLQGRVRLIKCDIFSPDMILDESFDAVVSNPPYIPTGDIYTLMPDVRGYEPELALDGGADGMAFYAALSGICAAALKSGGLGAFEIGAGMGSAVAALFDGVLGDIRVLKDFSGHDRVVAGEKS